jgi:phosphatidylglycerophosphate synthase
MVHTVRTGPLIGMIFQLALLAALAGTVGLGTAGWVVGIACGVVTYATLTRSLARSAAIALGPADRVTLARSALVAGVAALITDSFSRPAPLTALVTLTVIALGLDAVDGWVARRTDTVSPLGARFDMEVDAFLLLVLSVYVARTAGAWVLAIGAARYAFVAAGWLLPWMRGTLPPRYWRKVVAAIQGLVLMVAMADVLPHAWTDAALAGALVLLTESFGRDVWWLWRHRRGEPTGIMVRPANVRTEPAWPRHGPMAVVNQMGVEGRTGNGEAPR